MQPRVSIARFMLAIVAAALALVGFLRATDTIAGLSVLTTLALLAYSSLAMIYRTADRRAFWVGFSLVGCGYMALVSDFWLPPRRSGMFDDAPKGRRTPWTAEVREPAPELITTRALVALEPRIHLTSRTRARNQGIANLFDSNTARTQHILEILDRPIPMPFRQETDFEAVLQHIRDRTADSVFPEGIPIYVVPLGLEFPERGIALVQFNVPGVPLRTALGEILGQLDMAYHVRDGMLVIEGVEFNDLAKLEMAEPFYRVGHCEFALLFALAGGLAARRLHSAREVPRSTEPPASAPAPPSPSFPSIEEPARQARPELPEITL